MQEATLLPPTHDQIEELLAPYALGAVDPEEAEAVRGHLPDCAGCRAALEAFRETADLLAAARPPAPRRVWAAIAARLERR